MVYHYYEFFFAGTFVETISMGHLEEVVRFCEHDYISGTILIAVSDNYQAMGTLRFPIPIKTKGLIIELAHPSKEVSSSNFEVI